MTYSFSEYYQNYTALFIFIVISSALAFLLLCLPFLLNRFRSNSEKISTYECGFENIGDSRMKFDVQFYLIGILFVVFDLEIAFMFPWAVTLKEIGNIGYWSMISFIVILTIGFIYEWTSGVLEWK